ncbi:MAG: hypothetical protein JSS34_06595 [Proteobacteria bacterium]|nr:hypothetical protein [Pseudomonadota bacterium]
MTIKTSLRWTKKQENTLNFDDFECALKGHKNKVDAFILQRNHLLKKVFQGKFSDSEAVNMNLKKGK